MTKSYVKTTVDLDNENLDAFKSIYPMRGAIKWFVNQCLERFVEIHKLESSPEDSVNRIVDEVMEVSFEEGEGDE